MLRSWSEYLARRMLVWEIPRQRDHSRVRPVPSGSARASANMSKNLTYNVRRYIHRVDKEYHAVGFDC